MKMKKLSFSLMMAAILCFAACGNNQNKKTAEEAVATEECTESCCNEENKACCEEESKSCCGGEECEGDCEKECCDKTTNK